MRGVAGPEDELYQPFDAAKAPHDSARELDEDGDVAASGAHDVSLTEAQLDALAALPGAVGALGLRPKLPLNSSNHGLSTIDLTTSGLTSMSIPVFIACLY